MSQAGSNRKFLRPFAWLVLAAGCYGAGYWHGGGGLPYSAGSEPRVVMPETTTDAGHADGRDGVLVAQTSEDPSGFHELLAEGAWFALERWMQSNPDRLTAQHGQALKQTISQRMNKYDALVMRRILKAYLDAHPSDIPALFLLSDLQQMSGMPDAALESLFEITAMAQDAQTLAAAMTDLRQILNVMDAQLRARGAHADREVLWRGVSQRLPASDHFRFEWAGALAASGSHEAALRVLDETGTSDVQQQDIDHLRERIERDAQGVFVSARR